MLFHAVNISEGTTEAGCEKPCHLRKENGLSVFLSLLLLQYMYCIIKIFCGMGDICALYISGYITQI